MAASEDWTGNITLGGNWKLEAETGAIETVPQALLHDGVLGLNVSENAQVFNGHTFEEFRNQEAFAALKSNGSVITWGSTSFGGDSSSVSIELDGTIDIKQIYSSFSAFAALRADGSVVTWGNLNGGGDSSSVADKLDGTIAVEKIYSARYAFAVQRADGSVITWGHSTFGGDSSLVANDLVDVKQIYSTNFGFAALRMDGSVVTWGDHASGGDSSNVADKLDGTVAVEKIYSTGHAFAALRVDGSVVAWGWSPAGGNSINVANMLDGSIDVKQVFSSYWAFAALRADGSVVTWGLGTDGGDSSSVASKLDGTVDVLKIYSTDGAFVALRADGSVVTWGNPSAGGDSSSVADKLDGTIGVENIYSSGSAFAALRADGSVVTWGSADDGGDSSSVANELVNVKQIYSSGLAFAALRADGSVVTWGNSSNGGDSSSVAAALDGTVDVTQIYTTYYSFAALRADGSVITWGDVARGGDSSAVAGQLSSGVVGLADIYTDDFYTADAGWQISPIAGTVSEADGVINFTMTRPNDRVGVAETVYVSTTQNHGSVNTNDYVGLLNIPYTFAAGETSKTVAVDILSDSMAEADETFGLIVQTNPTDPISISLASTTFTITENVIPPINLPPTAEPVSSTKNLQPGKDIPLSELFTWNDPNGITDVVSFAVRDRGIGGGYLTKNNERLQDDQLFDNVPITEIAKWAFVAGEAGSTDDVAFNAIDAAGASNTPAAVATVTATEVIPPILQKPSEMELEYFAKGLAYDSRLEDPNKRAEIESQWGNLGYKISEVFHLGSFLAVGLDGVNKEPVLAIRGSAVGSDWIENFDFRGVGFTEFNNAWKNNDMRVWLNKHPGSNITGHSQGGAQAQFLAAEATGSGIQIGNVLTFNSPGIARESVNKFNQSKAGAIKHIISSGDLVQLAGSSFIPGQVERYNIQTFDQTNEFITHIIDAHTGHWSDPNLYSSTLPYINQFPPYQKNTISGYEEYTGSLTLQDYQSPIFSFLYSGGKHDLEYFKILLSVASISVLPIPGIAVAGSVLSAELATRGGVENLRSSLGLSLEIIFKALKAVHGLGVSIQQTVEAAAQAAASWTIEAWKSITQWSANKWEEAKTFTIETWQKTKDWTAEVWKATVHGTKDFFNALKEKTADAVNALVESGNSIIDSIDPKTQVTSPLIFEFLSKNESVEVVVPENGVATAPAETPTIFFGVGNNETFNGGSNNDLFFGGGGSDIYNLGQTQTSTQPTLRTFQNLAVTQGDQQIVSDILSQGSDTVVGTAADLDGDTIFGFANDDAVFVVDAFFTQNDLSVTKGSAILQADVNQNGTHDFTLTLKGNYELDQFVVETQELGTLIRYKGVLEPVLVDDNGTVNEDSSITFSFAQLIANDLNVDGINQKITAVDTVGTAGSVVIDSANQTITYRADADQFDLLVNGAIAMDSFKYIVQGNSGESSAATVSISVTAVNDGKSLFGTVRRDTLNGTSGEDVIKGNNGDDTINGLDGADRLFGENGDDKLDGGNSIDTLSGGSGNDRLKGGNGDDFLTGGEGNDLLEGGVGNDWLNGEKGNDWMIGGTGSDIFAFAKSSGHDVVNDFINGVDKIQIANNTGVTNFSQLKITSKTIIGNAAYTTIDLGSSDKIFLVGVSSGELDATDFIFSV